MGDDTLKSIVAELDVIKTWFSPGSARHSRISVLADKLAEHAGGREELPAGDPNQPSPGPGVRSTAVTEVDSIGQVEDTPTPVDPSVPPPSDPAVTAGKQRPPAS